ncbi:MAG TPA: adenylate/guanylate cyclase domain-containing protein [Chloroflexota bacterium]|nr:adenylate/guanylate cyclase domain-containing protein [Chloroflexota bacterium]
MPSSSAPAAQPAETAPAIVTRTGAVLCVELLGLELLLEDHRDEPERILERVNDHLDPAMELIRGYGGVVERYMTRSLLASFGVRSQVQDAPHVAFATAMALVGTNQRFNQEHGVRKWLDVAVGVAAGRVAVGQLGSNNRRSTILGDCVVVAEELARRAKAGEVVMDGAIYKAVAKSIRVRPNGPRWLLGRNFSLESYTVVPVE